MSSIWGKNIKLSIFGESHAPAIGMVLDGFPPGLKIDWEALSAFTARRTSRDASISTPRQEKDIPEFVSGLLGDTTCGTPLCAVIRNKDTRSQDYGRFSGIARPGHADYTGYLKYHGFNDPRGGGHFSGRLTAPLVLAGGICKQYLAEKGIVVSAHIQSIGSVQDASFDPVTPQPEIYAALEKSAFPAIDPLQGERMMQAIRAARENKDSIGGVVECIAAGIPPGLGSPIFDTVEGRLAQLLFAIPAVKGVEFGNGFSSSQLTGSQNNDPFYMDGQLVKTKTNRHGGILGGITSGMPVLVRAAFKPTPTIGQSQQTVDYLQKKDVTVEGKGRHDPCIVPRAVVCVESAMALALTDILLDSHL